MRLLQASSYKDARRPARKAARTHKAVANLERRVFTPHDNGIQWQKTVFRPATDIILEQLPVSHDDKEKIAQANLGASHARHSSVRASPEIYLLLLRLVAAVFLRADKPCDIGFSSAIVADQEAFTRTNRLHTTRGVVRSARRTAEVRSTLLPRTAPKSYGDSVMAWG
jgi:hypothetical protein